MALPTGVRKLCTSCCGDECDIYSCCVGTFGGSVTNWDYPCDRHRDHQGFHDCTGCCPDCGGTGMTGT